MAVTYTASSRSSSTDSGRLVRFVDTDIKIMSPETVPFLKYIGIDGEPVTNYTVEWYEDKLNPESYVLNGTINSTAVGTFTVVDGGRIHAGMILKVTGDVGAEYVYVSSVSSNSVVVQRGCGGTSKNASINGAGTMFKVGLAGFENASPPTAPTTVMDSKYNYCQIFEKEWQISQRAANAKLYGTASDPTYQEAKKVKETMIELEQMCILGKRATNSTTVIPMMAGGLDYFISTNATDLNDASLELQHLMDALQDIYYLVGGEEMGKTILCAMDVKQQINDMFSPSARRDEKVTKGGVVINTIESDFGVLEILESFRCPKDTLFIIKPEVISIHPFAGSRMQVVDVPATGAWTKRRIYGDYTIMVPQEEAMGKIYDIDLINE